jgi:hypothetical protein
VKKNNWLFFNDGKIGCLVCKDIGHLSVEKNMGMRLSKEWMTCEVTSYGDNRKQILTSLWKMIFDHNESSGHKAAVKITVEGKKEAIEKVCLKTQTRGKEITNKIFRAAYKVAKMNQSFCHFEREIDLQELNGVDMGRILHSSNSCTNIVNHIGIELRMTLIKKIVDSKSKLSLILDESQTVILKSVLVIYICTYIEEIDMKEPVNFFIDLVELIGRHNS